MSRKSLGVLALTLAFSTTLMAQSEPFLGIWEIDLERTSNYPMQTQMIINLVAWIIPKDALSSCFQYRG